MSAGSRRGSVVFERVTKRYGEVVAVREVSFEIEAGALVTLLGPSGCGKTTTLRMIAGLELPSSGKILIGGKDVTRLSATERDVGMVFQSYALFPHMRVLENVCYGLLSSRRPRREAEHKAREMLALVGLEGTEARLPSELSGGQQQRVALARALVLEPEVLLFDEPLSNLDAKLRRRMREEIREIQERLGITAVYVTHDQDEALSVSDRILVMDRSVVVQEGSPRDLYERPRSLFVARFMGDATVVSGALGEADGEEAELELGPARLRISRPDLPPGPVSVALRPQAILLGDAGGLGLPGKVRKAAYLGESIEYTVESELGDLFVVSSDTRSPRSPGDEVSVTFDPGAGLAVLPREPAS